LYAQQGCLAPVKIVLPASCVLNPSAEAAVVGGNVLTSQRVTDVILKAFGVCAASQGCMNNLTLGHATLGYYEVSAHLLLVEAVVLFVYC
jgi:5-oxoprolinase (ATP-hydrolysing)